MCLVYYTLNWLDKHFNNSSRYSGISDWVACIYLSFLNVLNLYVLFNLLLKQNIFKQNPLSSTQAIIAFISSWVLLFIVYRIYYRGNRMKTIETKFANESKSSKYFRGFLVISYMVVSVLLIFTIINFG